MPKSTRLRTSDLRNLFRLTGECRDLGDDPAAWRDHWFASLARLVGAAFVCGGEAALVGGRHQVVGGFDWGLENGFDRAAYHQLLAAISADVSGREIYSAYAAHPAGNGGGLSRKDLLADRDWHRSLDYAHYSAIGVDHTLVALRPVPGVPDHWGAVVLYRPVGETEDFTGRHRRLVEESYAQLTPLYGGPLARHTEPSPMALPPRVREVLRCLLEGDGDKQVARRLGISPYTVNEYTKQIYRHFRVAGRAELLARWLRRAYPTGFPWAGG